MSFDALYCKPCPQPLAQDLGSPALCRVLWESGRRGRVRVWVHVRCGEGSTSKQKTNDERIWPAQKIRASKAQGMQGRHPFPIHSARVLTHSFLDFYNLFTLFLFLYVFKKVLFYFIVYFRGIIDISVAE